MDIIQQRIYSPFTLIMALLWVQIGTAFEIGSHHYISDWGLEIKTTDLIHGSFSFFNYGTQFIQAIALKKKGVPLLRCPDFGNGIINGVIDMVAILGDLFLLFMTISQPILYAMMGRESSSYLIPFSAAAGVFSLIRLWQNLGPNKYTFWGGTLFLVFALLGVFFDALYAKICVEFLHVAIAGSFACSMIPLSIAVLNAELPGDVDVASDEVIKGAISYAISVLFGRTRSDGADDLNENTPLV